MTPEQKRALELVVATVKRLTTCVSHSMAGGIVEAKAIEQQMDYAASLLADDPRLGMHTCARGIPPTNKTLNKE